MQIEVSYNSEGESVSEQDELKEEQVYWNANDGHMFILLYDQGDAVTIAQLNGEISTWEKEGTIFNDECVGTEILPVEQAHMTVSQTSW